MKQPNENVVQDQDIIELGVASIETKGGGGEEKEPLGQFTGLGISEE